MSVEIKERSITYFIYDLEGMKNSYFIKNTHPRILKKVRILDTFNDGKGIWQFHEYVSTRVLRRVAGLGVRGVCTGQRKSMAHGG